MGSVPSAIVVIVLVVIQCAVQLFITRLDPGGNATSTAVSMALVLIAAFLGGIYVEFGRSNDLREKELKKKQESQDS